MSIFDYIGSVSKDKVLHFIASLLVTLFVGGIVSLITDSAYVIILSAFGIGVIVGLAKEFYDVHTGSGFDFLDAIADLVGIGVGVVCILLLIL